MNLIDKSALVAEIENLENKYKKCPTRNSYEEGLKDGRLIGYKDALHKINTLGAKGPYEQCVQYDSIKAGIQAHAETYSFNIESELFNQLTKEQQELWRKEIEQACISGGEAGAKWQTEQFKKERLKHCDALTAEQAQIESDFVMNHLKKHNRTPTFIDAIEYGMRLQEKQMMAKAVDGYVIENIEEGNGDFLLSAEYLPKSMGLKDRQKVKVIVIKEY